MNESFLQYIWKYKLFNFVNLQSIDGERLTLLDVGQYNTNEGPDFLNARIKIADTVWVGHVEIHIKTSDWSKHRHNFNPHYAPTILHVVYEHDVLILPNNVCTLELKSYIKESTLLQYKSLVLSEHEILCKSQFPLLSPLAFQAWIDKCLTERWEEKNKFWQSAFQQAYSWEEQIWLRFAHAFGGKLNGDAMFQLAQSIPLNVLYKHLFQREDIEALLFGQAGMLHQDVKDEYPQLLREKYNYLAHKYQLENKYAPQWKHFRLRPYSFPAIRIAQLAAILHENDQLFAQLLAAKSTKELHDLFANASVSAYWNNHFQFDVESKEEKEKNIGRTMINHVIINVIAPVQFAYYSELNNPERAMEAIDLLYNLDAETNSITRKWKECSVRVKNAAVSQALIQQYNARCTQKKCLQCVIGYHILKL